MTRHRTSRHALRRNDGFTMVVIAALFIAFSVVAAAMVERNSTLQFITRRDAALQQLQRLNNALIAYSAFNTNGTKLLYPCPADPSLDTTAPTFGASLNNGAAPPVDDCSTAAHGAGVGNMIVLSADVVEGMVPVQALAPYGVSLNDAYDPWNNRVMYVVNRQLTTGGTGVTTNNPAVTNITTHLAITRPDFVLISYGRDGLGATRRGQLAVAISCTSTGTYNTQNCNPGAAPPTFYDGPTNTAATAGVLYFDDIISYHNQ